MLLFKSTNQSFMASTVCISISYCFHLIQRKPICSNARTTTVEASLVSIFTRKPFCLESPELQELSSKLTPEIVETVLKSFRNWRLAQLFFSWASKQEGYSHSCYTYNALAAVLSNARQIAPLRELAESILISQCLWTPGAFGYFLRLNEMRDLGCRMDKHSLTPALQCYCSAGMFDKALMVFNELNEKGWVDQHVLAILLVSYSKCGEVDMAFELIEWAERNLKISLNEKTLCVLIHGGLCKNREMGKALMLYTHMKESGISPDVQIISQLLSCISEERDMVQLLEDSWINLDMVNRLLLYNSVLTSLVNGGNVDKAYHLLKATTVSGLNVSSRVDKTVLIKEKPDTTCFQTVIDGLCKVDKLDMAVDLFHIEARNFLADMTKEGFLPDMIAYSATIDGFLNINELDQALKLFREICERGYCPDVVAYNTIIKGLCKAKRITEAEDILNEIFGKGLVPSVVTYNLLIDGWCKNGDTNQAVLWFSRMIDKELEPNVITYTTLIDGLCNAGKSDEALNLWTEMENKGCDTNRIAYMAFIHGLCKCRKPDVALVYFQKMEEKEMLPDSYIYRALIDAFAANSNTDMAHEVLEKMIKRGTGS
ncbi:UNVERIFIED_CONTAM: putative pentatricopeptide repeat-containing protein, mitochondrial [Sesamum radiatum]|uniref:Pentatricopeptide repeat-containing protein, mitochondrial n=1 Tax=Sesamum radiatum TaxID=300843 RepID=A0AAW2PJ91_SESRA